MNKDKAIRIMMNEKEREMLEDICNKEYMNMSQMIRSLIFNKYKELSDTK